MQDITNAMADTMELVGYEIRNLCEDVSAAKVG